MEGEGALLWRGWVGGWVGAGVIIEWGWVGWKEGELLLWGGGGGGKALVLVGGGGREGVAGRDNGSCRTHFDEIILYKTLHMSFICLSMLDFLP